jgi:hypothetical protein
MLEKVRVIIVLKKRNMIKIFGLGALLGIVSFSGIVFASEAPVEKMGLYESIQSIKEAPMLELYNGGEYVNYSIVEENSEDVVETLWQYAKNQKEPIVIAKADEIRFKVCKNNGNVAIIEKNNEKKQNETKNNVVKVFNSSQELVFEKDLFESDAFSSLKIETRDKSLDLEPKMWSDDGRYIWVHAIDENVLFRLDIETKEIMPIRDVNFGEDVALNPNKGWICYSNYSTRYEKGMTSGVSNGNAGISLAARDLINGQIVDIATKTSMPFMPKWLDDNTIVYLDRDENWVSVSWN